MPDREVSGSSQSSPSTEQPDGPDAWRLGLSDAEAQHRLTEFGPNALPGSEHKPLHRIVLKVLAEPMFLMLLVAGALYLALGDHAEAAFLLAMIFAVIGLTLFQ